MSRSKRKRPFMYLAGGRQDTWWKQLAHKRMRTKVRSGGYDSEVMPLRLREVLNLWSTPRDGKARYLGRDCESRWLRK